MRLLSFSLVLALFAACAFPALAAAQKAPASCIAFSAVPGWREIPSDGSPAAATFVHERTGAVIRAFIAPLNGRNPRALAQVQFADLANTGHRIITTSCCAIDSAVTYAWRADIPALKNALKKRGKRKSFSGDDGTSRRGIISIRTITNDPAHAVVIVGSWAERDHASLQKTVTDAVAAIHLE